MKYATLAVLLFTTFASAAKKKTINLDDYPLTAHIKKVEMRQEASFNKGSGGTNAWHLMITEIDGKTYGLSVHSRLFGYATWLHVGDYPCRPRDNGFEVVFPDDRKQLHTEVLVIMSEE